MYQHISFVINCFLYYDIHLTELRASTIQQLLKVYLQRVKANIPVPTKYQLIIVSFFRRGGGLTCQNLNFGDPYLPFTSVTDQPRRTRFCQLLLTIHAPHATDVPRTRVFHQSLSHFIGSRASKNSLISKSHMLLEVRGRRVERRTSIN